MSHTSAFTSCRMHHNGGYDGDVTITNEDSTSRAIGSKATIRTESSELMKIALALIDSKKRTVTVEGVPEDSSDSEGNSIIVWVSDVKAFAADALSEKITSKMESGKVTYPQILKMAVSLGIPTDR